MVLLLGGIAIWHQQRPAETTAVGRMALPLPDKPSIVVLPFVNMSGDPKQGYLGDGIVEDITTDLTGVISR